MKMPQRLHAAAVRFNQMSLRERVMVAAATLGALTMLWVVAFKDPLSARERALNDDLTALQMSMDDNNALLEERTGTARNSEALARIKALEAQLRSIDAALVSKSAGLIPPERMVEVIHDVLRHQRGLKLISLHNQAVQPLVPPKPAALATAPTVDADSGEIIEDATAIEPQPVPPQEGPFVHPVELVIEGSYLDVLRYLRALEESPWRFYWKVLELETVRYPVNRVRIELTTLSMDKEWVGV